MRCLTNLYILRFLESGIIQHWNRHIDYPKGEKFMLKFFDNNINRHTTHSALALDNVISGFYTLLIGLLISIIVFLFELFF